MAKPTNITPLRKRGAQALAGGNARVQPNDDWGTPAHIFGTVRNDGFNGVIDLDPATWPSNPTGARVFYTKEDDGLKYAWPAVRIFCNPPYSALERFIDHAIAAERAGARIYLLVPVRTDAAYHHRLIAAATDVLFLRGRVKFVRQDGSAPGSAAFASMIVGLGISTRRLKLGGTIYVPTCLSEAA